jgi:hypothetical protein
VGYGIENLFSMAFSAYQYNVGDPLSTNITAMTLPDASNFEIAGLMYP